MNGAGYWIGFPCTVAAPCPVFEKIGNSIVFGKQVGTGVNNSSLAPAMAKSIDSKLDDGNASRGNVMGLQGQDATSSGIACNNSASSPDYNGAAGSAQYQLSVTTPSCRMFFWF